MKLLVPVSKISDLSRSPLSTIQITISAFEALNHLRCHIAFKSLIYELSDAPTLAKCFPLRYIQNQDPQLRVMDTSISVNSCWHKIISSSIFIRYQQHFLMELDLQFLHLYAEQSLVLHVLKPSILI